MKLHLSRVHFPVTVLGPGRRLGIWVQGCNSACSGCISRDTWSRDGGYWVEVEALVANCHRMTNGLIDGVTITGGEPFGQPKGLAALLDALETWRNSQGFDVLCYSGLPLKRLKGEHSSLLARLDVLIPEPFIEGRPISGAWRGSDNQPLVLLSELGRERYATLPTDSPAIQIAVTDGSLWFIGIPRRGDMDRLQLLAEQRGLTMENISWHP